MRVLLYTKAFHPMVGGIETVTATMAELLNKLGCECEVLTPVENREPDAFIYKVHRRVGLLKTIKLIRKADLVVSNGASLSMVRYCLVLGRPFMWIHQGYQSCCIDGLGWVDGERAPLTPRSSLAFHYKRSGLLFTAAAAFKLFLRRVACKHIVVMNVAVSDWVAMRQPFEKQIRIHNPFPIYRFGADAQTTCRPAFQFLYLGRLVSEKGVSTLIRALALMREQNPGKELKLLIVGEGNWFSHLTSLTEELGIQDNVVFAGRKTGQELIELLRQGEIAVVPSEWEEPMGGVALELLAAGKPLIVSRQGGLAECVGDAALLFDNGDHVMLAECMTRLLNDKQLRATLLENAKLQVKQFDPERLIRRYVDLFAYLLGENKELRSADPNSQAAKPKAESVNLN
jgi:glycosyltransferase involved in cell wall biosynthesis